MKFKLILRQKQGNRIPFHYQHPLSAAIYKLIQLADADYAKEIHDKGHGKGFKFFTFSDLNFKDFKWQDDFIIIHEKEIVVLYIDLHVPQTYRSFMKGIFANKTLTIADTERKTNFTIISVEVMDSPIQHKKDNEVVLITTSPTSPICVGRKNERGNYDYLSPQDENYTQFLLNNWREKVKTFYPNEADELMEISVKNTKNSKSKLIILKAHTPQETKIKGYKNFEITIMGKKKLVELLIHGGLGLHNAQGMGSVRIL